MSYCIETRGLSYHYSKQEQVLNNVHLKVPEGTIYGFLGPNGAGKTTTLRLMLGLLKQQQGDIEIFGKKMSSHRMEILQQLGSLIESPSLYGHLSARENLLIWQTIYKCDKSRVEEVLKLVGLAETGKKKVSKFSLGMKQRLSIGVALLHSPKLLVLDEPTNGLDPQGIIEMRELLRNLNREEKITIIVSSHLLSEIEKLVTHLGIIYKGEIQFQGTLEDLKKARSQAGKIVVETNNNPTFIQLLSSHGVSAVVEDRKVVFPFLEKEKLGDLLSEAVHKGLKLYEVSPMKEDLESIFMEITNQ
ncbi:MAG: ABC transporter ATP-binding protein [Flavobacteriales bacterium]